VKLTIVLRKHDAEGLGGEILEGLGMKRSSAEPQVFAAFYLAPDIPGGIAPVDMDDSMFAIRAMEALMDQGIRPVRVFQKTNSPAGLTPVFGSAGIESDSYSVDDALADMGIASEITVDQALAEAGFDVEAAAKLTEADLVLRGGDVCKWCGAKAKQVASMTDGHTIMRVEKLCDKCSRKGDYSRGGWVLKRDLNAKAVKAASKLSAGYTHYWNQKRDFTDQEWKKILLRAKSIIKKATEQGIALASGDGNGKPELTPEYISLNGAGDESYESFSLGKKLHDEFNFTKTNERPYDPVVVSLLAMIKKVAKDAVDISSDGEDGVFRNPPITAGVSSVKAEGPTVDDALESLGFTADDLLSDAGFRKSTERASPGG